MYIVTRDNKVIHDIYSWEDYLASLGFDKFDIENLRAMWCADAIAEENHYKDIINDYEMSADDAINRFQGLCLAMDEIADKLDAGKGTKAQLAQDIRVSINYWQG